MWFLLPLLLFAAPDDLLLLPVIPGSSKQRLAVEVRAPGVGKLYGGVKANDPKFLPAGGKKPVRLACTASLDGDDANALVVVREHVKKQGRNDLRVYDVPDDLFKDLKKPCGTWHRDQVAARYGDARIEAIGPFDAEGDGRDELLVLVGDAHGNQTLELRPLPHKKKAPLAEQPLRAIRGIGNAFDRVVALFGFDANGVAGDELAVFRRDSAGTERLEVLSFPPGTWEGPTPPLASYPALGATAAGDVVGAWRVRIGAGTAIRALVLREDAHGGQRLELLPLPDEIDDTPPPKPTVEPFLAGGRLLAASGLIDKKPYEPPPWSWFPGKWAMSYRVVHALGGGHYAQKWIGPFEGFTCTVEYEPLKNEHELVFAFPPGSTFAKPDTIAGVPTSWEQGAKIHVTASKWPWITVNFHPQESDGFVMPGDRITVSFPVGALLEMGPYPAIGGSSGTVTCGEVVAEGGWLKAVVYEYRLVRVP